MKYLGWIVGAIVTVIAVVFAIHNRQIQSLDFWPLPFIIDMPVYVLILATIAIGFCIGAGAMWISDRRWRRLARTRGRENRVLKREIETLGETESKAEPGVRLPAVAHAGGASSRRR